jgi:hypothetical protein
MRRAVIALAASLRLAAPVALIASLLLPSIAHAQDQPPLTTAPVGRRNSPPQPQQKPGPDYLAGTWTLTWTGRESPITAGPRTATVVFTRQSAAGNTLAMTADGRTDAGAAFKESATLTWNEANKTLTIAEHASGGIEIRGVGDWSSPLSIRFESEPLQVRGQSLRLRRTYSILSAVSFSVAEELSTDGGAYQRLGRAEYIKK